MTRIGQEIVESWKEQLSARLGRTAADISINGLLASDFNSLSKVVLRSPLVLECTFHSAFSLVNPEIGKVAVFTEHSGYHEFYLSGMKVSSITCSEYWDEDYSE